MHAVSTATRWRAYSAVTGGSVPASIAATNAPNCRVVVWWSSAHLDLFPVPVPTDEQIVPSRFDPPAQLEHAVRAD